MMIHHTEKAANVALLLKFVSDTVNFIIGYSKNFPPPAKEKLIDAHFKKVGFRYTTSLGAAENPICKSALSEVMSLTLEREILKQND